jgi:hypothetical protein
MVGSIHHLGLTVRDAAVVVFRDPDNIQLELFFEP